MAKSTLRLKSKFRFATASVILVLSLCSATQASTVVTSSLYQASADGGKVSEASASTVNELAGSVESNDVTASASDAQYRSSNYYPVGSAPTGNFAYSRLPNWNRDSYTDAAQEYGYNGGNHAGQQQPVQPYGPQYGGNSGHSSTFFSNNNNGDGYDLDAEGSSFEGAGLGGLAGILGLKGLKGLGLLGLLKGGLGLGFLPLMFLFGLPLLLLLLAPLLLFVLPFPVITIPSNPTTRTFGVFRFADISNRMTNLARSVLESEKCMERVSCEISRVSRGSVFDRAVTRMIYRFEVNMPGPLRRMARAYMEAPATCAKYSCNLIAENASKKSS